MGDILRVGVAAVDITPPVGVDLSGFGGRASGSTGIHDPLFAKALVLDDGKTAVGIITTDLIGVPASAVAAVREGVAARTDVPGDHVMVTASHTHSGPCTSVLRALGEPDQHYCALLTGKLIGVAETAAHAREEAFIGSHRGDVQLGINRRERAADGAIRLGSNPSGPTAPYVDVVCAFDAGGQPRGVLFTHAAHPVVLGGDNLLVSADYAGYAQAFVSRAWPAAPIALFAQGCCGNINAHRRGSFAEAERLGDTLGAEVVKCVEMALPTEDVRLAAAKRTVELPLDDPPPAAETEAELERHKEELAKAIANAESRGRVVLRKGLVEWAQEVLALSRAGATGLRQPFEVQAFRMGDVAWIGLPGEVFVEYQRAIDKLSPFRHQFVFGYANGCVGYVPTAAAFEQGGYEVVDAIRYYGRTMLTPECERLVLEAATETLSSLGA